MIIIDEILVSDDVVEKNFVCNLNKCKGACCWEGDFGAPLNSEEIKILEQNLSSVLEFLDEKSIDFINEKGFHTYYSEKKFEGTNLMEDGACVFLVKDKGIAYCGIEKANKDGKIPLIKPISCHLYPIRITEDPHTGITMINYDKWDICGDACSLGDELKMPVYQFVKNALIRKFGSDFYEQLEAAIAFQNRN